MNPQAQPVRPGSPLPTASVELRHLRYFLAVAEELSFTRAASRLNVVQQTLSEGIAQLEDTLGLRLFERTRPLQLTDPARQWLPYAREALEAAERARDVAGQLRAGYTARLRVGLAATAALPLTPVLLAAFRDRHPRVALSTRHFDFGDPSGGLLSEHSDVAIVRPPFSGDGLEMLVIASEPRYVALCDQHPLANQADVSFAQIADEPWIEVSESDPVWCAFWRLTAFRNGPPRAGASGQSLEDLLEAARTRQAVGVVPECVARAQQWPGLKFVQVTDIPPSDVAVAWRAGPVKPPMSEFIAIAREFAAPAGEPPPEGHTTPQSRHRPGTAAQNPAKS